MSLVQQVVNKAMIFGLSRTAAAKANIHSKEFRDLYETVSAATAENLSYNMDEIFTSRGSFYAPVIYMNVHENEHLNASVFTLKRHEEIPLHDHPGMFGLLKVIQGAVRISGYSYLTQAQHTQLKERWNNRSGGKRIGKLFSQSVNWFEEKHLMPVIKKSEFTLTPADPPSLLTPFDCNIHRVKALDEHAAFFDVLMPPYYPSAGRDCHYYEVLDEKEKLTVDGEQIANDDSQLAIGNLSQTKETTSTTKSSPQQTRPPTLRPQLEVAWIRRIPPPYSYHCDNYEYRGPFAKTMTEAELREQMKKDRSVV